MSFQDPIPETNPIDLCTILHVKIESAGRLDIEDTSLDETIQYKITDLSENIMNKTGRTDLDSSDRDVRMCCIYGVLGWLSRNKLIKEHQQVSGFRDGDFSINYNNVNSSDKEENNDCAVYKSFLNKLMPSGIVVRALN